MRVDDLVADIIHPDDALAADVRGWIASSSRFETFVDRYRAKIRKKMRGATTDDARRDVLFELATAYRLLAEPRFTVEYEPRGAAGRAPDLGATFRANVRFAVEARRWRGATASDAVERSLASAICDKIGQLPAGMPNVLAFGTDDVTRLESALARATRGLRERATKRDDAFFVRHGFAGARDFGRRSQRLSAILITPNTPAGGAILWRNPEARHALPGDLTRALISPRA